MKWVLCALLMCSTAFGQKNERSYLFAKWLGNGPIAQIAMTNSFGMPLDSSGYVLFNQALTGGVTAYLDSRGLNRDANGYVLVDCATGCAGATTAFSALSSATNSTAAMVIGTGASLTVSGSGTNTATGLTGSPAITVSSCTGCGSGALVQVETHTAASSAELDFTTCITSTYKTYKIVLSGLVPATNAVNLTMQFSSDGGATYISDSHYNSVSYRTNSGGSGANSQSGANSFRIDSNAGSATIDNTATYGVTGEYTLYTPQSTSLNKRLFGLVGDSASGGSIEGAFVQLNWATSGTAVNAFKLLFSSGNIASGTATCYGLTP